MKAVVKMIEDWMKAKEAKLLNQVVVNLNIFMLFSTIYS